MGSDAGTAEAPRPSLAPPARNLWQEAGQRLGHNRGAMGSAWLLGLILLAAVIVPWLSPYNYYSPQWTLLDAPPAWRGGHLFGTDDLGRDLLVRIMWGCRISLSIGLVASVVSVAIGVLWGATAGFVGGRVDSVMMRAVDILYSVPFIPFVIVLVVMFGRDVFLMFIAIGAVSWLDIARIVRGQTLSLRSAEFVDAARVSWGAWSRDHLAPFGPEPPRDRRHLRHSHRALGDSLRSLPELPRLGCAGPDDLTRRARVRRSQCAEILPLPAIHSGRVPGSDRLCLEHGGRRTP